MKKLVIALLSVFAFSVALEAGIGCCNSCGPKPCCPKVCKEKKCCGDLCGDARKKCCKREKSCHCPKKCAKKCCPKTCGCGCKKDEVKPMHVDEREL